jgi:hypothetical protein
MNHPASIPLQRPIVERWAYDVAQFIVRAWEQRRARRLLQQRIDAMADLNVHVLRDIGGPDDLLNAAAARRETEAQCLGELRILAGYRNVDSRSW